MSCAPRLARRPAACAPCDVARDILGDASSDDIRIAGDRLQMPRTLRAFYGRHPADRPAWSEDGCLLPAARELVTALREADKEGLNPADYHRRILEKRIAAWTRRPGGRETDARIIAEVDLLLSDAYLLYASHLLGGHTWEDKAAAQWRTIRRKADLSTALADALATNTVTASLHRFAPSNSGYRRLRADLRRYRDMRRSGAWPVIPAAATTRLGDEGPRVLLLRKRLLAEGYAIDASSSAVFDASAAAAVRSFQRRHGIVPDGRVGPQTLGELNVPVEKRIDQIKFSLDRWRWLPADLGSRYVLVNIPAFSLSAMSDGRAELDMPVVVGKRGGAETPILSNRLTYLEFSPEWNVPNSIATREMLPQIQADPAYLAQNHMDVLPRKGTAKPIDPATVDWTVLRPDRFPYRFRQRPGPWNALGKVKFMFPNEYSVYIHGTAEEGLFDQRLRMFSHGCVRVLDPIPLAQFVLNDPDWTAQRLTQFLSQPHPVRVPVADPVPVYLVYWTAWSDADDGPAHFREDVYGWDREWRERFYPN